MSLSVLHIRLRTRDTSLLLVAARAVQIEIGILYLEREDWEILGRFAFVENDVSFAIRLI
jgi:hypothetical protein